MTNIKCVICDKDFIAIRVTKICCSDNCQKIYRSYYDKTYYEKRTQHIKNIRASYQNIHKDMYAQYHSDYAKSDIGLKCRRKTMSKRRNLGFNPLNQYFSNSEAHHINKNDIIYMPKEWHLKGHNVFNGKNMESINTIAFFFLTMQNINNIR